MCVGSFSDHLKDRTKMVFGKPTDLLIPGKTLSKTAKGDADYWSGTARTQARYDRQEKATNKHKGTFKSSHPVGAADESMAPGSRSITRRRTLLSGSGSNPSPLTILGG